MMTDFSFQYVFTQPFHQKVGVTQGRILSVLQFVWIPCFFLQEWLLYQG